MNPFRLPRWRFMNCCGHSWGHSTEPRPGTDGQGASRRDFVKAAASGAVGLAALATLKDTVAAQVRVFPPPPPAVSPIEGLIDFHNHCAPDVFGRAVDDDEMAQLYLARKMEAVVLKNHVALTADRAALDALARRALRRAEVPAGLAVAVLVRLPDAVRTRVLHRWARRLGVSGSALSHRHVAALDALVIAWHGQGAVSLPGGLTVIRQHGVLIAHEGKGAS